MIIFYSGTPGSGKSLHVASDLYWWLATGKPAIGNFNLNLYKIKSSKPKRYTFRTNDKITPDFLKEYAQNYIKEKGSVKEDSILLVLDECQLMFNARDWNAKGRADWLEFFTLHRHLGYKIILIAQFDRMIDRQVRSLIEYEYIHRKMSNFGWKGKLITMFALGDLFVSVKIWYPMKEKVGSEIFRAKKFYYSLYDTYALFDSYEGHPSEDGGLRGSPPMEGAHPDDPNSANDKKKIFFNLKQLNQLTMRVPCKGMSEDTNEAEPA